MHTTQILCNHYLRYGFILHLKTCTIMIFIFSVKKELETHPILSHHGKLACRCRRSPSYCTVRSARSRYRRSVQYSILVQCTEYSLHYSFSDFNQRFCLRILPTQTKNSVGCRHRLLLYFVLSISMHLS